MYPLALTFFAVAVFGDAHRNPWEMIEVLLASNVRNYHETPGFLDDFRQLFDDFAEQTGTHYDDRNFRQLATYISGLPVAKYGLRYTNCEQLRQFLSGINLQQRYHLQYVSVKCGRMKFSYCMGFVCDGFSTVSTAGTSAPTMTHTSPFTYTTTSAEGSTGAPTTARTATTASSSPTSASTASDNEDPF
ncbi:unnamed protein product [Cylicocyclus nassatus]|uniref:Uncharacterized protein n=1 Tax=Cylicocyclus nassatus TaxID=53992 RepID=A0AA36M5G1_CYLNA|nr:unnamed protein product [Cylicocyclus nassatus]